MADSSGKARSPVTRINGSSTGSKLRVGVSSPKPLGRSPSLDKKKSVSSTANGDAEAGVDSPGGHSGNPLRLELNRFENELKVKDAELEKVLAESKALKQVNIGKDKAIAALQSGLDKLQERHSATEKLLSDKILELKKVNEQKKVAFSSQAAAEATIRRLQAAQTGSSMPSLEATLAPLEAQLKLNQREIAKLQEDNRAQERLMRSKEAALVKAEQAVAAAMEKAAQVDDLLNANRKLEKQIEAAQEEKKVLDKMYKQKVDEVKKQSDQIASLEEALTAAGGVASTIKDYKRQVQDLQAKLKVSQEELARAKVAVNRVAVAVANEWKDESHKVIPMQQWLEERKFYQGEAQSLREKVALTEKAVKFEAQMKEKYQSRLKVIEEGQKAAASQRERSRRASGGGAGSPGGRGGGAEPDSPEVLSRGSFELGTGGANEAGEEMVSATLYTMLEREVVLLRKSAQEKDQTVKDKEDAVEMLSKKVELLTRAMEVEAKKTRREVGSLEKELAALRVESSTPEGKRRLSNPKLSSPGATPRKSFSKTG